MTQRDKYTNFFNIPQQQYAIRVNSGQERTFFISFKSQSEEFVFISYPV